MVLAYFGDFFSTYSYLPWQLQLDLLFLDMTIYPLSLVYWLPKWKDG